jgi:hypothetical protein
MTQSRNKSAGPTPTAANVRTRRPASPLRPPARGRAHSAVAARLAVCFLCCIGVSSLFGGESPVQPVTPDASPEAVELLNFFYRISGTQTLSGQHNYPGDKDRQTVAASKTWGKTPAIFGKDWGFAKEGYKDILSLDCYREFQQSHYEALLKLANGKPIALAEVGNNLSLATLEAQPKWVWWMKWAGIGSRGDTTNRLAAIVQSPRSWSLNDPDYRKAIAPIRVASGLSAEPPAPPAP